MRIYHKSTNIKVGNGDNKTFPYFIFPTLMWAYREKSLWFFIAVTKKKYEKRKKYTYICI